MFSEDTKKWAEVIQGEEASVMSVLILQFLTLLIIREVHIYEIEAVSYTHLTLPTIYSV